MYVYDFFLQVVEIVNGDGMNIKLGDGTVKKIFLASVRPPRPKVAEPNEEGAKRDPKYRARPLYDIPYMFEAREFLRKKLIDKKVGLDKDNTEKVQIKRCLIFHVCATIVIFVAQLYFGLCFP